MQLKILALGRNQTQQHENSHERAAIFMLEFGRTISGSLSPNKNTNCIIKSI